MSKEKRSRFDVIKGGAGPRAKDNRGKVNPLSPHVWPVYWAREPAGARDHSATDEAYALRWVALEERIGKPISAKIVGTDLPRGILCAICTVEIPSGFCFSGPTGVVCEKCMDEALSAILDGKKWPT